MSQAYLAAYKAHQRNDETVRETEAHALLSCASRLEAVRQEDSSKEEYYAALKHNQELWTLFQVCLCEPDNPLPLDLKRLLLNISRYVDKATFKALSEGDRSLLQGLITINRHIAAGLQKKVEQENAQKLVTSSTTTEDTPHAPLMTSA